MFLEVLGGFIATKIIIKNVQKCANMLVSLPDTDLHKLERIIDDEPLYDESFDDEPFDDESLEDNDDF